MVYALIIWLGVAHAATDCDGLLLNAEPFGFGPTAAIAQFAPKLQKKKIKLGFIGEGHALDLQRDLGYRDLREVPAGADDDAIRAQLRELKPGYSHFFTALDFRYARLAREEGYEVGLYDPLTWFWSPLPDGLGDLDLYVVQSFVGVDERILADLARPDPQFPARTWIVPAITPRLRSRAPRSRTALVNLGGLRNPYLPAELTRRYAAMLAESCALAIDDLFGKKIITVKPRLVETIPGSARFTPAKIHRRLERAQLALMTPGLGSLFEASAAATPVVWLPPTNDSQGQQVVTLERQNLIDARLSWGEITGLPPLDYFADQRVVMAEIERRMRMTLDSAEVRERFQALLREKVRALLHHEGELKLVGLTRRHGVNGTNDLVEMIQIWLAYGP